MAETLGGLYSIADSLKRRAKDSLRDPIGAIQQAFEYERDKRGRPRTAQEAAALNPSEENIQAMSDWWNASPLGAVAGVIKPKGGNWLSGSVEDALRGLKRGDDQRAIDAVRRLRPDLADREVIDFINPQTSSENLPINQWIEGPLTKYVKTRMASPEDEVRRLAEQGVLHYEPGMQPGAAWVKDRKTLAQSPLAVGWEWASDQAINPITARDLSHEERVATFGGKQVPHETRVYNTAGYGSAFPNSLGFNHLIDELSNALNPASGLPRNLQLTPEAMQNMSMEKAFRRVADINAWRAAQKAEANRKLAEQAFVVREYAENNPKGLRWVELKASNKAPEGADLRVFEGGAHARLPGMESYQVFPDEPSAVKFLTKGQLQDQLKYEGDVMQHCVGGYCDDVLSGRSRIFSLRDAKGEPHVTIETSGLEPYAWETLPEEVRRAMQTQPARGALTTEAMVAQQFPHLAEKLKADAKARILQIKGKQNRAPSEEYLPFVQDFVRSGKWSDVGDLQNTGLRRVIDAFNSNELKKIQEAGIDVPQWATQDELDMIHRQVWPNDEFAQGGLVTKPRLASGHQVPTCLRPSSGL